MLAPSAYAPAVGGVEEVTRNLAAQLVAGGDEVEIWTIRHPLTLPAESRVDGLVVRRFEMPLPSGHPLQLAQWPLAVRRAWKRLSRAADDFSPHLLHVHCFSANGVYAAALAARRHIPLVVTLHGETVTDDNHVYERSASLRAGLRYGLRSAAAVTAPSGFVLNDAQRFGLPQSTATVVPNGIELNEMPRPEPVPCPFRRFLLGVGRMVPNKGFDRLISAFSLLAPGYGDLGLLLAGEGPERIRLRDQAAQLGVADRVVLTGTLSPGKVAWLMQRAAALVLPSRVESFGVVVLEAMRAGCPVVASACGGVSEVVTNDKTGLVVDASDPETLAGAISAVLDDEALAERLVATAREWSANFDWLRIAELYRSIYRAVA